MHSHKVFTFTQPRALTTSYQELGKPWTWANWRDLQPHISVFYSDVPLMEITSKLHVLACHDPVRPKQKHMVIRTEHCTLGPVVSVALVTLLDLLRSYCVLQNSTAFLETILSSWLSFPQLCFYNFQLFCLFLCVCKRVSFSSKQIIGPHCFWLKVSLMLLISY